MDSDENRQRKSLAAEGWDYLKKWHYSEGSLTETIQKGIKNNKNNLNNVAGTS